jgi:DNA polymerase-3 subunit epsilon
MREIVLDTETTGLDPGAGHRIVEVGALELLHHLPTGRTYQCYLNPERDMPEEAERIHGLSAQFLSNKPKFGEVAEDLLAFLGDAKLVIHNAAFDLKFLNAEFDLAGLDGLDMGRAVDTVQLARQRFPGAQVSLDALCKRFEIDNSARTFHGALLDCELLAEVYLELRGGRQPGFELQSNAIRRVRNTNSGGVTPPRPARHHAIDEAERAAHEAMLRRLKSPIWSA